MLNKKALAGTPSTPPVYVEDVFSTYLYTGTGASQTITNNIDLAGKGGLVWTKSRSNAYDHGLTDTSRGNDKVIFSNLTNGNYTTTDCITSFNSNGFTLGTDATLGVANNNTYTYASWTFREQAKFFDVVTYTGTGSARTVAHNLGSVPGMIIVKRTDTTGNWQVYHRANTAAPETDYLVLNSTAATADSDTRWNDTLPTSTEFSLGTDATVNANTGTYVAYLFAHDAGGFGAAGTDNVISCGSYTGTGAAGNFVSLGYEPQYVLIKRSTVTAANWFIHDVMRGMTQTGDSFLYPNLSNAEGAVVATVVPNATGFTLASSSSAHNESGATYIYMAIRRPMKTPTSGTEVFSVTTGNFTTPKTVTTNFPVDLCYSTRTGGSARHFNDRLRGGTTTAYNYLGTNSNSAELTGTSAGIGFDNNTAIIDNDWVTGADAVWWNFKRATGFFDIVCYNGNSGSALSHNLGVAPELIFIKRRNGAAVSGLVYSAALGLSQYVYLFSDVGGNAAGSLSWMTSVSSTTFQPTDNAQWNGASTNTYVAYLFATLAGVSKVGSYTGTGSAQTINCGFSAGARFVMIKRTDSTGDWYIYDTARGIVSGNDPFLLANTSTAQTTNTDYIDPANSGFEISSTAPAAINANGGSFIFMAIA